MTSEKSADGIRIRRWKAFLSANAVLAGATLIARFMPKEYIRATPSAASEVAATLMLGAFAAGGFIMGYFAIQKWRDVFFALSPLIAYPLVFIIVSGFLTVDQLTRFPMGLAMVGLLLVGGPPFIVGVAVGNVARRSRP